MKEVKIPLVAIRREKRAIDLIISVESVFTRGGTRLPSECDYLQKKLEFMAIIH